MGAFEQAYAELRDFVRAHEGIRVTPTSLSVPRDVRPAFYELVECVQRELAREILDGRADRTACAEHVCGTGESMAGEAPSAQDAMPSEPAVQAADGLRARDEAASPACRVRLADLVEVAGKCAQVRADVCAQAGLAQFKLASMLESFMSDPLHEVARPLCSCVLDALQAGEAAEALHARAQAVLVPHAELLWRNAYEAWAYYGVVAQLKPVRFHAVFTPDMKSVHAVRASCVEVAVQASSPTLRLPEAVFETADGCVFAMKSEAAHELDFYGFKNKRRRDSSSGGNTADLMTHRVLLLWELASLDSVGFVADRDKSRIVPPALTVEVLEPADMTTPAYVSAFVERINAVRSRRPVQVIALDGCEQAREDAHAEVAAGEPDRQGGTCGPVGPVSAEFPAGMLDDPTVAPVQVHHTAPTCRFDSGMLDEIAGMLKVK